MMISYMNLFLLFSLLALFLNPKNTSPLLLSSSSETKLFDLRSLPRGYLTFLGDSYLQDRVIALTKLSTSINSSRSAGVVFYSRPILFKDPRSKKVPSFHTMFAFSIEKMHGDKEAFGDGLAFLISPNDDVVGSYLGLVDSIDLTKKKFIAIEFDTKRDSLFNDPDDNHVGLDINSLVSVKLATSSSLGIDLKSGDLITAWIDYKSNEKRLEVFLGYSNLKPNKPRLKVDIDLSEYLKENMFVGFSAATEGNMQLTRITQWEFTTMEFSPPPPPPPPSTLELGATFPNPSKHVHKDTHLSRFAIGLTIVLFSVVFVVLFGWYCWKKLMRKIQQSAETNILEIQTIKSSGAISNQELLLSILVDELARGIDIEKVLDNEVVNIVKSSISLCRSLPAVKPSILPLCNSLPMRTNDIGSV